MQGTGTAYSEAATYSADGSELDFVGRDSESEPWSVYVANPEGTEASRLPLTGLAAVDQPVFTSSGNAIVFDAFPAPGSFNPEAPPTPEHRVSQAFEIHTDGSGLRQITTGEEEVTSPTPLPEDKLLVTKASFTFVSAGFGGAWIKDPPRMSVIDTDGATISQPSEGPSEMLTGATAGTMGAHAGAVDFPPVLLHKTQNLRQLDRCEEHKKSSRIC
ncbi:MAG TPA: hypothetical protein VH061_02745 [Solirubrobacteraceae bacterium]|nr:hypothetical protein [Solirubrobacteraceae bacterium]